MFDCCKYFLSNKLNEQQIEMYHVWLVSVLEVLKLQGVSVFSLWTMTLGSGDLDAESLAADDAEALAAEFFLALQYWATMTL